MERDKLFPAQAAPVLYFLNLFYILMARVLFRLGKHHLKNKELGLEVLLLEMFEP